MRIINTSIYRRVRPDPDQMLDAEIHRLQTEMIPLKAHLSLTIPRYAKEWYLSSLESFAKDYNFIKRYELLAGSKSIFKDPVRTFHCFTKLPVELRMKIWQYAFVSHLEPRIHCIKELNYASKSAFLSNQPISPLLHACVESRTFYIDGTKATFAFKTYLNFEIDIIYIIDLPDAEESFPLFLQCVDTGFIQKIAMRKELACHIPLPGNRSESHQIMRDEMPHWKEMILVFRDEWTLDEAWTDRYMKFRDLTSRQKRMGYGCHAVMYARMHAKVFNRWAEIDGDYPLHYGFVALEKTEDNLEISFENLSVLG